MKKQNFTYISVHFSSGSLLCFFIIISDQYASTAQCFQYSEYIKWFHYTLHSPTYTVSGCEFCFCVVVKNWARDTLGVQGGRKWMHAQRLDAGRHLKWVHWPSLLLNNNEKPFLFKAVNAFISWCTGIPKLKLYVNNLMWSLNYCSIHNKALLTGWSWCTNCWGVYLLKLEQQQVFVQDCYLYWNILWVWHDNGP